MAVHCKNWDQSGWGYVDVGLYAATEGSLALTRRRLAALQISDPMTKLAAAYQIRGDQPAIDQLVARRPKLAGPIGDLFAQDKDWPARSRCTARGSRRKPPTSTCSRSGPAPRRRSRTGMPPRPTGRGPRPEIRKGPNCSPTSHNDLPPATRFRWRKVSLKRLKHFTNDRWGRTLRMTWWPPNSRNCCRISKKMATPLAGRSSSRRR